jgi:rubrerythrin
VKGDESDSDSDEDQQEFSDSDDEEFVVKGKSFTVDTDASPKRSSGRAKSWTCSQCTFINNVTDAECPMCGGFRHVL